MSKGGGVQQFWGVYRYKTGVETSLDWATPAFKNVGICVENGLVDKANLFV